MDFASFMGLIDANHIYQGGKNMAQGIFTTITPMLLITAIWLRLSSNQLASATSGQSKWGEFFRDLAIWVTILGLYFTLASFVTEIFNVMYTYFFERGSLGVILRKFAELIKQIDESSDNAGLMSQGLSILGSPVTFVVWLIYYVSFLLATILLKFLKLAHAICWSFSLVWGLIAIPMSLTSNFKLLKGWGIFTGITLLWPIIHFGGFALFNPIFENAANEFVSGSGLVSIDKAQLYLIMTVVNILAIAIALSAPFIAMSLISNSGSIAGVVAPFATAAVGAAAAATVHAKAVGSTASRLGGRAGVAVGQDLLNGRNPLSRVSQGMESLRQGIMGPSSSSGAPGVNGSPGASTEKGFTPSQGSSISTPSNTSTTSSGSSSKSTIAKAATIASSTSVGAMDNLDSPGAEKSTSSATSEHTPPNELQEQEKAKAQSKKQQRRGAIINNLSKPTSGNK